MKRKLSILLVTVLLFLIPINVCAKHTRVDNKEITVSYQGNGIESYQVEVPAVLTPGESGIIHVSGMWPSNKKLIINVPNTVVLKNNNTDETISLDVFFAGMTIDGNNIDSISEEETIQIDDNINILFGTWSGILQYEISLINTKNVETLTIYTENGEKIE